MDAPTVGVSRATHPPTRPQDRYCIFSGGKPAAFLAGLNLVCQTNLLGCALGWFLQSRACLHVIGLLIVPREARASSCPKNPAEGPVLCGCTQHWVPRPWIWGPPPFQPRRGPSRCGRSAACAVLCCRAPLCSLWYDLPDSTILFAYHMGKIF